jgi:hypothetical protein
LSYKYLEGIPPPPSSLFPFCYLNLYWGHVANNESLFDVKEICLLYGSLLDYCLICGIEFAE